MKYLITGATGLVGTEIMKFCAKRGIFVNYLTTSQSKLKEDANSKGFYWKPSKGEIDLKAFEGVTHIIHLAGATVAKRWTAKYKQQILDSRTKTANLLFSSLSKIEHCVSQIVSASGVGVYPHSLTAFYDEKEVLVSNDFLGKVVQHWEKGVDQFVDLGIKVTKLRIGLVLSNKGGAFPKMYKPIKFHVGSAFGSGEQWQSWIHVQDLARQFLFVLDFELEGVFNAVAPNPVIQNKLIKTCGKVLGRLIWMPNVPRFMMQLILGEMHQLLFGSQRVSSQDIQNKGFNYNFVTIDSAVQDLLEQPKHIK